MANSEVPSCAAAPTFAWPAVGLVVELKSLASLPVSSPFGMRAVDDLDRVPGREQRVARHARRGRDGGRDRRQHRRPTAVAVAHPVDEHATRREQLEHGATVGQEALGARLGKALEERVDVVVEVVEVAASLAEDHVAGRRLRGDDVARRDEALVAIDHELPALQLEVLSRRVVVLDELRVAERRMRAELVEQHLADERVARVDPEQPQALPLLVVLAAQVGEAHAVGLALEARAGHVDFGIVRVRDRRQVRKVVGVDIRAAQHEVDLRALEMAPRREEVVAARHRDRVGRDVAARAEFRDSADEAQRVARDPRAPRDVQRGPVVVDALLVGHDPRIAVPRDPRLLVDLPGFGPHVLFGRDGERIEEDEATVDRTGVRRTALLVDEVRRGEVPLDDPGRQVRPLVLHADRVHEREFVAEDCAVLNADAPDVAVAEGPLVGPRHEVHAAADVLRRGIEVIPCPGGDGERVDARAARGEAGADDRALAAALLGPEQVEVRAVERGGRLLLVEPGPLHDERDQRGASKRALSVTA